MADSDVSIIPYELLQVEYGNEVQSLVKEPFLPNYYLVLFPMGVMLLPYWRLLFQRIRKPRMLLRNRRPM